MQSPPPSPDLAPDHLASQLNALNAVARTLAAPLELEELLDAALKTLINVIPQADIGAIMLWDQSAGLFRPIAAVGYDFQILKEIGLRPGESITGKAYDEGKALLLSTPQEIEQAMADMRPFNREVMSRAIGSERLPQSAIAVPVTAGDHKFGVLVLEALDPNEEFIPNDLVFVQTLADLIALAIDRSRLEARADAVHETRRIEGLRSELMATLSHELRMPLATIQGYASALLMDDVAWDQAKGKEFLRLIEAACNDMDGMIKDLLDTALIGSDQFKLDRQPLQLNSVAAELAAEAQQRGTSHRILVDFPSGFPSVEVDPRWIKQVFRNLLDNAIKYSPQGGLIVIRGELQAPNVLISLADQGIGIAPADLIPLFEKYFRVRSLETVHVPGTGLGLPIARLIVEAHGGRIWVESRLGQGTTVYFSLPLPAQP